MDLKIITLAAGIGILLIINGFGNGFNSAYAKRAEGFKTLLLTPVNLLHFL